MTDSISNICNRALSEIGTQSSISSLEEASTEAFNCRLWYDSLRRQLIRTAPWGFCRGQIVLSQLGDLIPDQTSPYPWGYKYSYPSDCLKFRYVLAPPTAQANNIAPPVGEPLLGPTWMNPSRANCYIIANDKDDAGNSRKVLLTNVFSAIGVFNEDITDPDLFDDLFSDALVASLAHRLVIPLSGNIGLKKDFQDRAEAAILNARAADANESITRADVTVDWIETRGVGSAWGYGGVSGPATWGQWNCSWDNMGWSS